MQEAGQEAPSWGCSFPDCAWETGNEVAERKWSTEPRAWRVRSHSTRKLALQLADAAGDALELSLALLPPFHRGDHQLSALFLSHDQIGCVDVVHLLTGALQAVFEPQHGFLQVPFGHTVQLVNGLALRLQDDFGVPVDVGYLLHFDFQGCEDKRGQEGYHKTRVMARTV